MSAIDELFVVNQRAFIEVMHKAAAGLQGDFTQLNARIKSLRAQPGGERYLDELQKRGDAIAGTLEKLVKAMLCVSRQPSPPPRIVKNIVRDADGEIAQVIEDTEV